MARSRFPRLVLFTLLTLFATPTIAADFAVENVSLSSNSVPAGGSVNVTTTVRNVAGEFDMVVIYVYMSADTEITNDDTLLNLSYLLLSPGQSGSTTVSVTIPNNVATGSYYLGVSTLASNGDPNPANDTGAAPFGVTGDTCTIDSFEPDDTRAQARPIAMNTTEVHNHCDDPHDWFSFSAIAGTTYGIQNRSISYRHHTVLRLYDRDGTTVLVETPVDLSTSDNPKIVWTAPASGTYYVQSKAMSGFYDTGLDTTYAFTLADALAELEIVGFQRDPVNAKAGGVAQVYGEIANRGFAAAGPFDYALYLSTDPEVTRADRRISSLRFDGLSNANETSLAWVLATFPHDLAPGTYYLAAIIDDRDQVPEYYENNNTSPAVTVNITAPPCAVDLYEDDDTREQARPIVPNEHQSRNHCDDGLDWVYFDATGGTKYFLRALLWDGRVDTDHAFEIYDAANNKIATGNGLLAWTPAQTGRYHILVSGGARYTFAILTELPDLVADTPYAIDNWSFIPRGGLMDRIVHRVQNTGYADATPTQIRYVLSADDQITPADRQVAEFDVPAIPAGTSLEAWDQMIPVPIDQPLGVSYLGVIVDPAGFVPELNEDNNADPLPYYVQIVDPVCPPDGHEQNDTPAQARPISVGELQNHNFCEDGYDWMRFTAQAGVTYSFLSTDVAYGRVQLAIYDGDGKTLLAEGERSPVLGDPYRGWVALTAPATGNYYLRATSRTDAYAHAPYGDNRAYNVRLDTCAIDAYEQDDDATQARALVVGESQARNHCDDGSDWVALNVTAAGDYSISTSNLEANADTALELYVGSTLVAQNDNIGPNKPASRITYSFTQPGTYYLRVVGKNRGPGTGYTLGIEPAKGGRK